MPSCLRLDVWERRYGCPTWRNCVWQTQLKRRNRHVRCFEPPTNWPNQFCENSIWWIPITYFWNSLDRFALGFQRNSWILAVGTGSPSYFCRVHPVSTGWNAGVGFQPHPALALGVAAIGFASSLTMLAAGIPTTTWERWCLGHYNCVEKYNGFQGPSMAQ